MAFGDQLNDVEMLKQAYYSFAVANARDEVKKAARFQADSNVNNGVLKILQKYTRDLRKEAKLTHNEIDMMHVNFLIQITELLEHNDFLTAQSQKIREFYKYMAHEYPFLAFTFKGRIKSLIRAEEKFNGYIVEYIYDYYTKHGTYPPVSELKNKLSCFRDFIAYRIVLCMPKCHLKPGEDQETASIRYLYEIANVLPGSWKNEGLRWSLPME